MTLLARTKAVLARGCEVYRGTAEHPRLEAHAQRLDQPLRVAIAGRVKAGKSTLLNALVGDRLAPTDAGECTRIVTWYEDGHTYQVRAFPPRGSPYQLRFDRDGGAIQVDLAGRTPEEVGELVVTWPAQALRRATLVDTPGVGSLSEAVAARTWALLTPEDEETPADAVLYLLRHLHRNDLDFLRSFHDTEVSQPNPVNAVGVLSRADEIGSGRLDALGAARRIAGRLAADPTVRGMVQTVVPVAGLLAETAATLTETETGQLRRVAALPVREAEALLLSADRFVHRCPELGLTSLEREALLARFGLFGLRLAASLLRHKVVSTATDLAAELTRRSGITELRNVLETLFFARRDVLKSRSALLALDAVTRARPRPGSEQIAAEVEEIMAGAHPFRELRVLSAIRAGWVTGKPEVLAELERLIGGAGLAAHQRLDLPDGSSPAQLAASAGAALTRCQRRAEHPLTGRELAVAAQVAARSCEGLLAELAAAPPAGDES